MGEEGERSFAALAQQQQQDDDEEQSEELLAAEEAYRALFRRLSPRETLRFLAFVEKSLAQHSHLLSAVATPAPADDASPQPPLTLPPLSPDIPRLLPLSSLLQNGPV